MLWIEKNASGTYLWHWGDNGIFKAYVVADLKRRSAIILFDNSMSGLSVAQATTETALGGDHPSFRWLNYDTFDSFNLRFAQDLQAHGATQALKDFASEIAAGKISERSVNDAGYRLLREKQYTDAIAIFSGTSLPTHYHPMLTIASARHTWTMVKRNWLSRVTKKHSS